MRTSPFTRHTGLAFAALLVLAGACGGQQDAVAPSAPRPAPPPPPAGSILLNLTPCVGDRATPLVQRVAAEIYEKYGGSRTDEE